MRKTDTPDACTALERPDRHFQPVPPEALGALARPLTLREKAWNNGALRKTMLLILLGILWGRVRPNHQQSPARANLQLDDTSLQRRVRLGRTPELEIPSVFAGLFCVIL